MAFFFFAQPLSHLMRHIKQLNCDTALHYSSNFLSQCEKFLYELSWQALSHSSSIKLFYFMSFHFFPLLGHFLVSSLILPSMTFFLQSFYALPRTRCSILGQCIKKCDKMSWHAKFSPFEEKHLEPAFLFMPLFCESSEPSL